MKVKGRRLAILTGLGAAAVTALATWLGWPAIRFRLLFEPLGWNDQGYREHRHRRSGIVFVELPGGTFLMGSPEGEEGRKADEFLHEATLSPFLIAKYEVTEAQWRRATGSGPRKALGDGYPILGLFREDAAEFCRRTGLLLPTEAQWEYACRGRSAGRYGGTGVLAEMGWSRANSAGDAQPVGLLHPNAFGLHDLHGNAEEWCRDVYDEGFYRRPEASRTDPVCTSESEFFVSRGGFRWDQDDACRSAARRKRKAGPQNCAPGIRPVFGPLPPRLAAPSS